MEAELRDDPAAYRRHRAGVLAFVATILGTLPVGIAVIVLLRLALGEDVAASWGPSVFALALPAAGVAWLYGSSAAFYYRCPRCRGPVDRVEPASAARPNICYHCRRCAVIWDLGWGPSEPA
jgi:hypothetical protein